MILIIFSGSFVFEQVANSGYTTNCGVCNKRMSESRGEKLVKLTILLKFLINVFSSRSSSKETKASTLAFTSAHNLAVMCLLAAISMPKILISPINCMPYVKFGVVD